MNPYDSIAVVVKENQTKIWLLFAAAMGGATSFGFLKPLTWAQRLLSVLVSASAALFLAPAIVEWFLPKAPANSKIVAAIYYIVTATVMSAFPPFLKFVGTVAGDPAAFIAQYLPWKLGPKQP